MLEKEAAFHGWSCNVCSITHEFTSPVWVDRWEEKPARKQHFLSSAFLAYGSQTPQKMPKRQTKRFWPRMQSPLLPMSPLSSTVPTYILPANTKEETPKHQLSKSSRKVFKQCIILPHSHRSTVTLSSAAVYAHLTGGLLLTWCCQCPSDSKQKLPVHVSVMRPRQW